MEPRTLAVLEQLLHFRDVLAREHDLPPFKILGNETIRLLAEKRPHRPVDLEGIVGLSPKFRKKYGHDIIEAAMRALSLQPEELPVYPRQQRFVKDRQKEERMKKLKQWREAKAAELGIDAGVLVNNSMLEAVADSVSRGRDGAPFLPSLKKWQKEAFGADLTTFVKSEP